MQEERNYNFEDSHIEWTFIGCLFFAAVILTIVAGLLVVNADYLLGLAPPPAPEF